MKKVVLLFAFIMGVATVQAQEYASARKAELQKIVKTHGKAADVIVKDFTSYFSLNSAQTSAVKNSIAVFLDEKSVIDKSQKSISLQEYNYGVEQKKIELTYKIRSIMNKDQIVLMEDLINMKENDVIKNIKSIIY